MTINDQRVRDFIRVYNEEFGDELSADQAREMLTRLITLYELLARPLPSELHEEEAGTMGTLGTS